jgi:hypothetical protein
MKSPNTLTLVAVRIAAAGLLTCGSLLPVVASAAPQPATGTLVGSVTCGENEATPAANAAVAIEGINLQTRTDAAGKFILAGVPAAQTFTIDALDPAGSFVTSRFNVNVQSGQTLDIGSLDLAICPQPVAPAPAPDQAPSDYQPAAANED